METFELESCVRGQHIYQELWEAVIGEELQCQRERDNPTDIYAVAVRKGRTVVGHLPRRLSRLCALFIRRGGSIHCSPTGKRRYSADLPQGGLEIPCILYFKGDAKEIKKVVKLCTVTKKKPESRKL